MSTILLHVCCAICSAETINRLKIQFDEVILYYYNPNIEPKKEYEKRLESIRKIAKINNCPLTEEEYENGKWRDIIKNFAAEPEGGKRCELCFKMRLEKTAEFAKNNGCGAFTTTLTMGPQKNADLINKIGREAAEKFQIEFIEENFKKQDGFKKTLMIAKELGIYRQNYCGCLFSKNQKTTQSNSKAPSRLSSEIS